MQIASGLHRVGSDIVNSYLIVDSDGITIIDAGLPGYWKRLRAELAAMGKSLDDVRALILTHGDTDHIGFAARLHRETGIAAYIHEADVDRARLTVKKPNSGWGPVKIGPLTGFLWYSARHGGLRIRPATELQTVADNEVLDVPGSPRIIHTPGHTPGSIAVHVPALDALFLGDTMTTRNVLTGVTGPKPAPFTLEPAQALASLDRIEDVDATWLLPGHGHAWDGGVPRAVRLIRDALRNPASNGPFRTFGDAQVRDHAVGETAIHGGRQWVIVSFERDDCRPRRLAAGTSPCGRAALPHLSGQSADITVPDSTPMAGSARAVHRGSATLGDQLAISGHAGRRGTPRLADQMAPMSRHPSRGGASLERGPRSPYCGRYVRARAGTSAASTAGHLVFQLGHL